MTTTPTTERSTMIAVFANRDQANQAIDNLRRAGYGYDSIRLVERGANSFVENLKSLFTGQTSASTNSPDDWMRIGVPEEDARGYQSEIDAGRSIVLIKAVENPEQALSIMRQSGAYDIATRLRYAQPAMTQGTWNPNAQPVQPGTYNPNVAPGAPGQTVQQWTYNPNAAPGAPGPAAQPGPYDERQP
jgi:hypothetical protein